MRPISLASLQTFAKLVGIKIPTALVVQVWEKDGAFYFEIEDGTIGDERVFIAGKVTLITKV